MKFVENIPIYVQIADDIRRNIVSGELSEGDKLPSVRECSVKYSVTAITIQRAVAQLEEYDIVQTRKGVGSFVAKDVRQSLKRDMISKCVRDFVAQLREMGLSPEEIVELVREEVGNG
ncbi:MAG: GntR family transcriptional regulator [Defluviitaleaceae bacterium]|nr:GntR family transcriptional regulator [Defluviitaleaceae bacterium]